MTSVVDAKRAYFKQAVGTTDASAVADLEALYYEKALAGTAVVVPEATPTVEGTVKQAAFQADSVEVTSPTVAEFNALLAKLIAAGIMAAS